MKRTAVALGAGILLPVVATAAPVAVDVRVAGGMGPQSENWIEFCPDRGAYVALYATFSDGTMHRVFPVSDHVSHWVDGWEMRAIPVEVPRGACLTDVQAVASLEWFDPAESWVVSGPREVPSGHRVVHAGTGEAAWGFVVGWSGPTWARNRTGEVALAAAGTNTSVRRRGSGEPVRRSGR